MSVPALLVACDGEEANALRLALKTYRMTLVRLSEPPPKSWLNEAGPQGLVASPAASSNDAFQPKRSRHSNSGHAMQRRAASSSAHPSRTGSYKASAWNHHEQQPAVSSSSRQEKESKSPTSSSPNPSRIGICKASASNHHEQQPAISTCSRPEKESKSPASSSANPSRMGNCKASASSHHEQQPVVSSSSRPEKERESSGAITAVIEPEAGFGQPILCNICGEVGDAGKLLLCDGPDGVGGTCDAAYHYDCLGLEGVPAGDWFCPRCKPRTPGRQQQRRSKLPEKTRIVPDKTKRPSELGSEANHWQPLDLHERRRLQSLLDRFPEEILDRVAGVIESMCGPLHPGQEELKLNLDVVPSQKQRSMLRFVEEEWAEIKAASKAASTPPFANRASKARHRQSPSSSEERKARKKTKKHKKERSADPREKKRKRRNRTVESEEEELSF